MSESARSHLFTRLPDGSVEIEVNGETVVLDAAAWASQVAAVSRRGENEFTYEAALNFHNETDLTKCSHPTLKSEPIPNTKPVTRCPDCRMLLTEAEVKKLQH